MTYTIQQVAKIWKNINNVKNKNYVIERVLDDEPFIATETIGNNVIEHKFRRVFIRFNNGNGGVVLEEVK